jgi:hypothetical protein
LGQGREGNVVEGRPAWRSGRRDGGAEAATLPASIALEARGGAGALIPIHALALQRAIGNRATAALLGGERPPVRAGVGPLAIQRLTLEHHALNDDPTPAPHNNCFMAVLTWLLRAERGVLTTGEARDLILPKGPGPLMQAILGGATMLRRPVGDGQLRVTAGRIVIFASGGFPTHAAVATGRLQITGYNQTNWFRKPANVHTHSSLEGVTWVSATEIRNSAGQRENVFEADPAAAVHVFG